jgi:hypothetical protein
MGSLYEEVARIATPLYVIKVNVTVTKIDNQCSLNDLEFTLAYWYQTWCMDSLY